MNIMSEQRKAPTRPLPNTSDLDTMEFWAATRDKILQYQQCDTCQKIVFYPRQHCTGCTAGKLMWHQASGRGVIYSYSVVRQSYHPFFRNLVPYAVAWIDLEEGPRMLSNVTGVQDPVNDISIGQAVELVWEEHDELNIPLFRPVS